MSDGNEARNTMPDAVRAHEFVTDDAHIGRYRIERRLETTPTSEVMLAVSEGAFGFERAVIIKRLLPHAHADPKSVRGFAQEASAYARLTHPAIVRLYDFLTINESPAMVLEHFEGVSLKELLEQLRARGERLPREAALYVGARVFAALSAAHEACDVQTHAPTPIVHRDVCPANVLLGNGGEVKLSNFGFAKFAGAALGAVSTDMSFQSPKGTIGYMAPEQLLGRAITPQTDVYLGALLVRELLVGEPAFVRRDEPYVDYLQAMASPSLPPIPVMSPGLPRVVAGALQVALEADSASRRISASDLQRVLAANHANGRARLCEILARLELVRSGGPEPQGDSSTTGPSSWRLERRARRARVAAGTFALLALIVGGILARSAAGARGPGRTTMPPLAARLPVELVRSSVPAHAAASPAPSERSTATPALAIPAPTTGELEAAPSALSHRVFVDGHLMGESGTTFTLACGPHRVRIGSGGREQTVTVACGGTTVVAAR